MSEKKTRFTILSLFKSVRTTMLCLFSLLIIITTVIFMLISVDYTKRTILENSTDYTSRLVRQVNRDIDSYIDYMENISSLIIQGGDVQKYLFIKMPRGEMEETYNRIVTQFNTVVETRQDISNIAVVTPERNYIINGGTDKLNENVSLEEVEWYREALEGDGSILTASHVQHVIRNNYKWVVTLGKGIKDPRTGKNGGVFFIDLNYKLLKDLCENNSLATNSYVFIVDESGKIIYHPRQQLLYNGLKTEKISEVLNCGSDGYFIVDEKGKDAEKLYTVSVSDKTGWRVVGVADISELMKNKKETEYIYMVTAAVLLCIAMILANFFATAITRPIKELKDSMKEVEKGNFHTDVVIRSDSEIDSLGNSFNLMTARIRQLMDQNIYEQEEKRKSELKALRSQINPHFLYNTFDSIIWMAEGGKNREVVRMTSALARLLRQSISNDNERIPLEKEVDYAGSYLTIQKMRYKDKLEYEIEVEEDIRKEEIINLILQPLVENAIYHGIKYKGSKGLIRIVGYGEGNNIILKVIDNGIGMDEAALKGIFDKSRDSEGSNGVGVYNVQTRIRLYYGAEYGLHFESALGEGTTVTITIPRNFREGMDG